MTSYCLRNLLYLTTLFIFSHTLYFREPKCLATSIRAPEIICGSREVRHVLKRYISNQLLRIVSVAVYYPTVKLNWIVDLAITLTSLLFPCNSENKMKENNFNPVICIGMYAISGDV